MEEPENNLFHLTKWRSIKIASTLLGGGAGKTTFSTSWGGWKSPVLQRENQQKFNNFAEKLLSTLPSAVEKTVNKLFHLTGWRSIKIVFTSLNVGTGRTTSSTSWGGEGRRTIFSPRRVEESPVLRREIQQKFNKFSKKFILLPLYGVEEPLKQATPPPEVE